jgi:hypothetical protein
MIYQIKPRRRIWNSLRVPGRSARESGAMQAFQMKQYPQLNHSRVRVGAVQRRKNGEEPTEDPSEGYFINQVSG